MLRERVRLMYMPKEGVDIKEISLSGSKLFLYVTLGLFLLFGLSTAILYCCTDLFNNYQIFSLEKDQEQLEQELYRMKERLAVLNQDFTDVEKTSDELRNAANLEPIDDDIRQLGVGGPVSYSSLDLGGFSNEINRTAHEINLDLDKLERVIHLEKNSMAEISQKMKNDKDRLDRFPSIRPIMGGRINSPFGFRSDPFTGKISPHKGVDFPMPKGTKILAAAGGKVIVAKTQYTPNKSYGREIVIDHGYGFKTRYAHLSKIYVRPGQRIKRWEPIGEVGETGRASGPHLHYEVIYAGKRQDPENYLLN